MLARTSKSTSATTVATAPRVVMIVLKKFLTINVMVGPLTVRHHVIKRSVQEGFHQDPLKGGFKIYVVTLYMISYIKILLQEIYKVSRLIELRGIQALYQFRGIKRIICFKGYP